MRYAAETIYREHVAAGPECLEQALDAVLPADSSADNPANRLTRELCFGETEYYDTTRPAFAEQCEGMLDHGVRQVALAAEVLADDEIRDRLPAWFDLRLFSQALVVADAGLAFVSKQEIEVVHEFGPKYSRDYTNHPEYGYGMARAIGAPDAASQTIAAFMARHHMIQARNAYGLDWWQIDHSLISPSQIDLMVALQKPFDYFDDCFDRPNGGDETYDTLVAAPLGKFIRSSGQLLCANLSLVAAMDRTNFDPGLPNQIAAKIEEAVLGQTAIGDVYRGLKAGLIST
ncbi:MAG TPA: hypothetical protein VLH86_01380 [Patescibacteria group bacterium]|nr:hypothetical protein [Patescibacteria group bacterium]